jgi:hypothetical protein
LLEAAITDIVDADIPGALREVQRVALLIVGVVDVVGHDAGVLAGRHPERLVAPDEQRVVGVLPKRHRLHQGLGVNVHSEHLDPHRGKQVCAAAAAFRRGHGLHHPPHLQPLLAAAGSLDEVLGVGVDDVVHLVMQESRLAYGGGPAGEVVRVDAPGDRQGVEEAVAVVVDGVSVRGSPPDPGPALVHAHPSEGELAVRPVEENHDETTSRAVRWIGRQEGAHVEALRELTGLHRNRPRGVVGLWLLQSPVVRADLVVVAGLDRAGVAAPEVRDCRHGRERVDLLAGDGVDEPHLRGVGVCCGEPAVSSAEPVPATDGRGPSRVTSYVLPPESVKTVAAWVSEDEAV